MFFFRPNMSTRLKIVQSFQHKVAGTSFWKPIRFLWLVGPLEGWRPVILVSMSNKGRWVVRPCLENSVWSEFSSVFSPCIYQREVGSETFSWKNKCLIKVFRSLSLPRAMTCGSWEARTPHPAISLFSGGWSLSHLQCAQLQKTAFSLVKSRLALGSPGWLIDCSLVCHHAKNWPIHRKMVGDWPIVITSIVETLF